jgi:hypothetical protein
MVFSSDAADNGAVMALSANSCHRSWANERWEGGMIRCARIWTGDDGDSLFEEGSIDLADGARGDLLSGKATTTSISFQETTSGGTFAWHDAPARQFVITLSGTLDFQTRKGDHFMLRPGDILLAEDTTGSGHSWRLVDDEPWRRAYMILAPGAGIPFVTKRSQD